VAADVGERAGNDRVGAQHRDARAAGLVDEQEQRDDHADDQRGQDVQHDHAEQGQHGQPELARHEPAEPFHLVHLHQVGDRVDDQSGEHRLGQVGEQGVSATTVTRLSAAAMIGDSSVRAPAPSLTADWDRLPPQASPPCTPEPRLARPSAIGPRS
jgi:hypothetical protein